jgi:hypothetical protein
VLCSFEGLGVPMFELENKVIMCLDIEVGAFGNSLSREFFWNVRLDT